MPKNVWLRCAKKKECVMKQEQLLNDVVSADFIDTCVSLTGVVAAATFWRRTGLNTIALWIIASRRFLEHRRRPLQVVINKMPSLRQSLTTFACSLTQLRIFCFKLLYAISRKRVLQTQHMGAGMLNVG